MFYCCCLRIDSIGASIWLAEDTFRQASFWKLPESKLDFIKPFTSFDESKYTVISKVMAFVFGSLIMGDGLFIAISRVVWPRVTSSKLEWPSMTPRDKPDLSFCIRCWIFAKWCSPSCDEYKWNGNGSLFGRFLSRCLLSMGKWYRCARRLFMRPWICYLALCRFSDLPSR